MTFFRLVIVIVYVTSDLLPSARIPHTHCDTLQPPFHITCLLMPKEASHPHLYLHMYMHKYNFKPMNAINCTNILSIRTLYSTHKCLQHKREQWQVDWPTAFKLEGVSNMVWALSLLLLLVGGGQAVLIKGSQVAEVSSSRYICTARYSGRIAEVYWSSLQQTKSGEESTKQWWGCIEGTCAWNGGRGRGEKEYIPWV